MNTFSCTRCCQEGVYNLRQWRSLYNYLRNDTSNNCIEVKHVPDHHLLPRFVKVRSHMRGRTRAENWLQHKSLHVFTHVRSRSGGGAGAKSAPQETGPTPNLPRPLRNRALQTIIVLKKWQIRPRPLRVCVNIPAVAERECQNPPASAPQPPRACVNVTLSFGSDAERSVAVR